MEDDKNKQSKTIVKPNGDQVDSSDTSNDDQRDDDQNPVASGELEEVSVEGFVDSVVSSNIRKSFLNKFGGVRGIELERTFVNEYFSVTVNNKKSRLPPMTFIIKTQLANGNRISMRIYAAPEGETDRDDQEYVCGFRKTVSAKMMDIVDKASDLMVEGIRRAVFEADTKKSA